MASESILLTFQTVECNWDWFSCCSLVWPIAFCNLAGKDAGQNNTKLLRGLNANVTYLRVLDNCLRDDKPSPGGATTGNHGGTQWNRGK
jgi:hypothetical protein